MEFLKEFLAEFNWKAITFNGLRILLILLIAWLLFTVSKGVLQRLERVLIKRGQAEGELQEVEVFGVDKPQDLEPRRTQRSRRI